MPLMLRIAAWLFIVEGVLDASWPLLHPSHYVGSRAGLVVIPALAVILKLAVGVGLLRRAGWARRWGAFVSGLWIFFDTFWLVFSPLLWVKAVVLLALAAYVFQFRVLVFATKPSDGQVREKADLAQ